MKHNKTVVGVDSAKRVFQLHWVEMETGEIVSEQLEREKFLEHFANRAPCLRVMANRSDRDPPSLYEFQGEKPAKEMRRGAADSIRVSRHRPALKTGHETAASPVQQHTENVLGKREASI